MRGNDFKNYAVKDTVVLLDSSVVQMFFCFDTFAIAENIYSGVFDKDCGILEIIEDFHAGADSGLQAILYGAVAAKNENVSFQMFLNELYNKENKLFLRLLVLENLYRMFSYNERDNFEEEKNRVTEFQWDDYYRTARKLGFTDKDFWASTPKRIWLLTRDKEEHERQEWLTRNYV